ncbi:hypothetical protein E2C01_048240 [Portunus trituberculatus]|uniref:Uncharacterized protein n=1 Tax=Portunus trituberculatus TaxID=210409 RepID=A0A5B7G2M9_PORTR|nr:hypothetical protein [Portunus trituberculatus]
MGRGAICKEGNVEDESISTVRINEKGRNRTQWGKLENAWKGGTKERDSVWEGRTVRGEMEAPGNIVKVNQHASFPGVWHYEKRKAAPGLLSVTPPVATTCGNLSNASVYCPLSVKYID